jgi:hypothetical protein
MLDQLPVAMTSVQRIIDTEMRSALPAAPVVVDTIRTATRPRAYRARAAVATWLARVADLVAPSGGASSHRAASSR